MKFITSFYRLPLVFLLMLLIIPPAAFAQDEEPVKLTHWLTPEEKLRLHEIGLGFVETDPPAAPIRNIAEFDQMQGVLIRYPFGIPMALIVEMSEDVMVTTIVGSAAQQTTVTNLYQQNGVNLNNCDFLIAPTNSYWTRDYGPWFVSDSLNNLGVVDFPYNRPRPQDDEIPKLVANKLGIPWYGMNLIHTGGNYMTDGYGISSSTTLVWEENPTLTHEQVSQKAQDYLGIDMYHVVPDPNGTYIDHIDCWAKFLAPDKILVRKVPPTHARYTAIENAAAYWAAQPCSYGYNYKVYRVNTPNDQPYTNSIIVNNKALIPIMNSVWDDSAKLAYETAMPGYEVIGFLGQPSTPWESTDALHCRVIGIADQGILFVNHIPISGNQPAEYDYAVNAQIIACSDSAVYNDSVLIWYRVNGGPFQVSHMTHVSGENYTGFIPKQAGGSTVQYYLYAADASGRHATAPFIGAADPYTFHTVYTDLTPVPDTLWFLTYDDMFDGKITVLHNFTNGDIALNEVEMEQWEPPFAWFVDSMSYFSLPRTIVPQDTFWIRIMIPVPLNQAPSMTYLADSMYFISSVDTQYVVIMVNDSLLAGAIRDPFKVTGVYLSNCYPNPLRESAVISYTLKESQSIILEILDINGRSVRTLTEGMIPSGNHDVVWDGTNNEGSRVPEGVYICRLSAKTGVVTKKIIVI